MTRLGPRLRKLGVIDKPGLLQPIDNRLCDLGFYAALFKMSQELTLTFGPRNECIECNRMRDVVRVSVLVNLCKFKAN
jgi:hypothetical protein